LANHINNASGVFQATWVLQQQLFPPTGSSWRVGLSDKSHHRYDICKYQVFLDERQQTSIF